MKDLIEKTITDTFDVPGGPTLKLSGLKVKVSKVDHEVYMDAVTLAKRDHAVLIHLIKHYSLSPAIPGKVANWMRKTIGLSIKELAELAGGIDPSSFSHATARNTIIDRLSAVILLNLAGDFVMGGSKGKDLIKTALHVGESLNSTSDLKIEEVA